MNKHDHAKNWREELAKVPPSIREAILNGFLTKIGSRCTIRIRPKSERIIVVANGQPVIIELSKTIGRNARIRITADPSVAIMRDQVFREVNSEIGMEEAK